jgi:hypothetical protein
MYWPNGNWTSLQCRFPNSGIPGSQPACGSPRRIVACHALLRQLLPRHPPYALRSFTPSRQGIHQVPTKLRRHCRDEILWREPESASTNHIILLFSITIQLSKCSRFAACYRITAIDRNQCCRQIFCIPLFRETPTQV